MKNNIKKSNNFESFKFNFICKYENVPVQSWQKLVVYYNYASDDKLSRYIYLRWVNLSLSLVNVKFGCRPKKICKEKGV